MFLYDVNTSNNSINEQLIERKLAIPDGNYAEYIRIANDAMSDLNGYKHQRIRQYIESQRTYNQPVDKTPVPPSSLFIERNAVDVRYEQPQKQQKIPAIKPATTVEPLPLPLPLPDDDEGEEKICRIVVRSFCSFSRQSAVLSTSDRP